MFPLRMQICVDLCMTSFWAPPLDSAAGLGSLEASHDQR